MFTPCEVRTSRKEKRVDQDPPGTQKPGWVTLGKPLLWEPPFFHFYRGVDEN